MMKLLELLKIHTVLSKVVVLNIDINGIHFDTIELDDETIYLHHYTNDLDFSLDIQFMNDTNLDILYQHLKSITCN